ncbi:MAG: NADH-quinone oxidoreductase subunit L [Coriobacteriia bacterium]
MSALASAPWLVIVVPLFAGVFIAVFGRNFRGAAWAAVLAPLSALACGVSALASPGASGSVAWLAAGGRVLEVGYSVDALSAIMLVVVGTVGLAVVVFSTAYMAGDRGWTRYFALLCVFTASMAGLVIADGLLGLFIGWELVGACSYLLIGFWFERPSAASAAMKAFLVTRVGDAAMLVGLALLWRETGSLSFATVLHAVPAMPTATVTAVALLLFAGAAGKSAQFPLHIWLPEAMEGPTPVSALIHAATMVAAGVFLVARVWPVFAAAPVAREVMLAIGVVTALGAASVAITQTDLKRVLAYSTISQLGIMFAGLGAGAWRAAFFHLVTHAAFKALLFLGAGSVIHATGSQELSELGGLWRRMPVTAATWCVGAAALAGLPPLSGFWSKDGVLDAVWRVSPVWGSALILVSMLTAWYVTRATVLAFGGERRSGSAAHEGGLATTVPLVVLACLAAGLGAVRRPLAEALGGEAEPAAIALMVGVTLVAALAAFAAWRTYRSGPEADGRVSSRLGPIWRWAGEAYGVDTVLSGFARVTVPAVARALHDSVDRRVIDGAVEGTAKGARRAGGLVSALQSGDAQWYAALMAAGVIVMLALGTWVSR